MKKGTEVSWQVDGAISRGHGTVISDEENGHVLVAVDRAEFEYIPRDYRIVIYCAVTWLKVEQPPATN